MTRAAWIAGLLLGLMAVVQPSEPISAPLPAWSVGDQWSYAAQSPTSGDSTFVMRVDRIEKVDEVPHYVVTSGRYTIYYRVSDLAVTMERLDGMLEWHDVPSRTDYQWPLVVGATWNSDFWDEHPILRTTATYHRVWNVAGAETLTLQAGSFETLKMEERDANGNLQQERWYAPAVKSWVKDRRTQAGGWLERRLIGYKRVPGKAQQAPKLPSDTAIIARAQQADVSTLDKTLKKQRVADWLTQTLGPGAKVSWRVTDCGEATGSPADQGRDLPICAEPLAKLPDGRQVVLEIGMGSHQRGIDEPYGLYVIAITTNGEPVFLKTLSELAAKLRGSMTRSPSASGRPRVGSSPTRR